MKIIKSVFEKSSSKISECPKGNLPEFALVGRSNVGKSSLINTLLNKKSIAKTSSKPGKTLLINHFKIFYKSINNYQMRVLFFTAAAIAASVASAIK